MQKSDSPKRKTFNINQKNNRFILKFFGEMDHNYTTIEKDKILTISKMQADNFEKKGQITNVFLCSCDYLIEYSLSVLIAVFFYSV